MGSAHSQTTMIGKADYYYKHYYYYIIISSSGSSIIIIIMSSSSITSSITCSNTTTVCAREGVAKRVRGGWEVGARARCGCSVSWATPPPARVASRKRSTTK